MLQRWMSRNAPKAAIAQRFQTGTLYGLQAPFQALVPETYMNLSGQVVGEAVRAGVDPARLVVLFDDKDLPLGMGRFRLAGSAGGHNGVQSVIDHLGTQEFARLRLGVGPFTRPLHEFVLQEWTDDEWRRIEALDEPFAQFMGHLAACRELSELPGLVNNSAFWDEAPLA